jgi:hypothetical protein
MLADCHEFVCYFTIAEQLSSALIWVSDSWRKYFFWIVTQTLRSIHRRGALRSPRVSEKKLSEL